MNGSSYFYQFLEPISRELAFVARELENSIFTGPRTMLTHSRVFIENILQKVILAEKLEDEPRATLLDRIQLLTEQGYVTAETRDALHYVRQIGNQASHDARMFRFSEALLSWEAVYKIVKWYVEVYGPVDVIVPEYLDPTPSKEQTYDTTELETRLKALEELLTAAMQGSGNKEAEKEAASTLEVEQVAYTAEPPGFTTIRTLHYKEKKLDIPYFLRDAFLLPQRFDKSETFLIRLGAVQQARIMSELPNNLEGLHKHVKRYGDKNDATLFDELTLFVEEEKVRRKLVIERPGELFLFYKDKHIIVTEELAKIPLTSVQFSGIPGMLRQLVDDELQTVGQLPKELVILAKYEKVGIGTVEKFFEQLEGKQESLRAVLQ